jgi:hypothetical protein
MIRSLSVLSILVLTSVGGFAAVRTVEPDALANMPSHSLCASYQCGASSRYRTGNSTAHDCRRCRRLGGDLRSSLGEKLPKIHQYSSLSGCPTYAFPELELAALLIVLWC